MESVGSYSRVSKRDGDYMATEAPKLRLCRPLDPLRNSSQAENPAACEKRFGV